MVILVAISLLTSHGLAAADIAKSGEPPLNVIIVDVCSARADHFGLYGYQKQTTPGMDALAKEGVVFDHAWSQSSWCLPNYATLLTGHRPEVHGLYANLPFRGLPRFEVTLAERMKKAGYDTAAFTGGVYFLPTWGLSRGFDAYVNDYSTGPALPGSFEDMMPQTIRWMETDREAPFFAYLTVDDLHAPYQSDDSELFDPGYDPMGIVHDTDTIHMRFFRAYNGERLESANPLRGKLDVFRGDLRHMTHLIAHYDASLRRVDRLITQFVERLKQNRLWEKSVVIITSDHGELLGERGLLGHTESLYEPIVHVPLIVHHPAIASAKGRRISELVERIDLVPTVLDVAGASYGDAELQGKSLLPLLRDPAAKLREYAYASSKRNLPVQTDPLIEERVIRDKRWKLHWYSYKNVFELYDLELDPKESKDVSGSHPEIVNRLSFNLLRQLEETRPHAPGLPSGKDRQEPSVPAFLQKPAF